MRYVKLSEEEKHHLERLYKTSLNSVVRQRCFCLLYSNEIHSIKEVALVTKLSRRTIERFFTQWELQVDKCATLSISSGRGAKVKLESVKELLPKLIEEHSRNLNPILQELRSKYNIQVCKLTLQNFLKRLRI